MVCVPADGASTDLITCGVPKSHPYLGGYSLRQFGQPPTFSLTLCLGGRGCGVAIFHPSLRRSSSHPRDLAALDVREDTVPQGRPRQVSRSMLRYGRSIGTPQAAYSPPSAGGQRVAQDSDAGSQTVAFSALSSPRRIVTFGGASTPTCTLPLLTQMILNLTSFSSQATTIDWPGLRVRTSNGSLRRPAAWDTFLVPEGIRGRVHELASLSTLLAGAPAGDSVWGLDKPVVSALGHRRCPSFLKCCSVRHLVQPRPSYLRREIL